ncbi:LuxR C-terminal-related transcriptional regulator [Rhodopirellula sp. MGV]|uniref:LuxR C-terminal-related transcriptional regulator n=1 Tax=Rhodopirellula sp. MGV TaxID=2023130 RepID=UPI000B96C2BA|nr:LuxR C-terminal-related transcriptional regulator [Rhodopirellula sp. MGV]OYP38882.1 hypothetical protein CGZ80_01290 [Rhodopirellula sp. MGV]PNY38305.1 hypothetical protein C2E31_03050 [Rhodopirellula baltica]
MAYIGATSDLPRITDFVAPIVFFSQDATGVITLVSDSVQEVLGFHPDNLIGRPLTAILNPDCQINEFAGIGSDSPSTHVLMSVIRADRQSRILSMRRNRVVPSDLEVRFHNIVIDVTDEVRQFQTMSTRLQTLNAIDKRLSEQEHQVAERIVIGMLNREIADDLKVSERTVDRRRASIMEHYGVDSAAELVSQLAEQSLLKTLLQTASQSSWRNASNAHQLSPGVAQLSRSA